MRSTAATVLASIAVACAIGCAGSIPAPRDQFAAAQADVGRAQEAGAQNVPEAKLHLELALEDLQKARQMMDQQNDNTHAERLTSMASAEAQLALSLTKQATTRAQAQAAQAELEKSRPR